MAREIFVSYKHADEDVAPLNGETTARDYVNELINLFEDDEIYKGEGDEDLSDFKDDTIKHHLKDKIYYSSMTLVLISPNMKNADDKESDQWIPWEVSYSLREVPRNDRTSHTNGILAVVLPDVSGSYEYYLVDDACDHCHFRWLKVDTLFQILRDNMLNRSNAETIDCPNQHGTVYQGESSYIKSVKWRDFVEDKEKYLTIAEEIRDNIADYDITKVVND